MSRTKKIFLQVMYASVGTAGAVLSLLEGDQFILLAVLVSALTMLALTAISESYKNQQTNN